MIQIRKLHFSYQNKPPLCYQFEVAKGEKIWLHGPSGVGKTTLFKLLLGFEIPEQGEITIDGENLAAGNVFALRQKMSYVPQQPVLGRGRIWELFREIFAFSGNKQLQLDREEVAVYLEKFGLAAAMLNQNFEELSGGEQQRVSIILTLLLKRDILLLDEAVSAIDPRQRQLILQELAQTDKTILLIAHDAPLVKEFRAVNFEQILTS